MAKTQNQPPAEAPPEASHWSDEDIGKIMEEVDRMTDMCRMTAETVAKLEPLVRNLQVEVASLSPMKESVPLDVAKGVKPDMLYMAALQGAIVGLITVSGPQVQGKYWDALADKALLLAERVYQVAVEKHGIK